MPTDRPTFHEAWYRIADMRPRLRATVQTKRQHYRGRLWHVVSDPANNSFYRLDDAAYHFVATLDGKRTVQDAWSACQEQLGDRAPTQGEAIQLLGQLYGSNLIQADVAGDALVMFERHKDRRNKEVRGYLSNLLFVRIPLFDPDHLLEKWLPLYGWMFSSVGMLVWLGLIVAGLSSIAGRSGELFNNAAGILEPSNLIWLYLSFAGIKVIHELGHGFACKKFGHEESGRAGISDQDADADLAHPEASHGGAGEVHATGIMLMLLTPIPYVDATSAWALRNKWRRAFVGAAGMYVELAVAAIAAMIWSVTSTTTTVSAIAYNVMFVASFTTLLFNANPLLRYDGYYILSDILEMPNLAQRGKDYIYYLVKKYVYGVRKPRNPAHDPDEARWLISHGVLSAIYRVFVTISIMLFVADKFFLLGVIMGLIAISGWVVKPIGRWVHFIATSPELARTRVRAATTSTAFVVILLLFVSVIQLPDTNKAEGVVEPRRIASVHMGADGFIHTVLASGTLVDPDRTVARPDRTAARDDSDTEVQGDVLVGADNTAMLTRRRQLLARKELAETQRRATTIQEQALAQSLAKQIAALDTQIDRLDDEIDRLDIKPPFAGTWVVKDPERLRGAYMRRGEEIGVVATVDDLVIRVAADQNLGPRIKPELGEGARVKIRVRGRPELAFDGIITRILPAGQEHLPSPALGFIAGGSIRVDPKDPSGTKAVEPFFEVHVEPVPGSTDSLPIYAGQRVVVRFDLPSRPLLSQGLRTLQQLIQRRFSI